MGSGSKLGVGAGVALGKMEGAGLGDGLEVGFGVSGVPGHCAFGVSVASGDAVGLGRAVTMRPVTGDTGRSTPSASRLASARSLPS